ncbi:TetR/AcrR family transcriptional regulator [Limnohabitans sp. Rim8]|jgi:AcrR family transcriptional regulator|uniref:TetR/AcrR family transcriptional regulator n=1 Tax=Limnohabitans sp. Rim8 TaxID=1100718 RepID=UPI0025F5F24F|nr:TetR/AcrR family transcriptional regulator [Limnohabitans sp. Rim8]
MPTRPIKTTARNPEDSRDRILQAARQEFAAHGLGGARVDRISEQAGINKRMLYHYFGNKDDLFGAVLEANYAHKRASEQAMRLENEEPREAIRKLVTLTWNYYIDHPEFMNLLNSANLHQARHVQASSTVKEMRNPFIHMIGNILDNGVKAGVFKPGVDPVQLYISIAGLSYFYLSNQHTLSAIFGRKLLSPVAKTKRLNHMVDMVRSYLEHDK